MFKTIENLGSEFLPMAQTKHSAGFDVKSRVHEIIHVGETKLIQTGVILDQSFLSRLPDQFLSSHYFGYHIRSSFGVKGLIQPNGVGVIDIDYPGEICGIIHNAGKKPFEINKGDRIGQLILLPHRASYLGPDYRKMEERTGGFGSTGEKDEA